MKVDNKTLKKIHAEIVARKLYNAIADTYGCTPQYVGQVLRGEVKYNSKIVEIATDIFTDAKAKEAKHLKKISRVFS